MQGKEEAKLLRSNLLRPVSVAAAHSSGAINRVVQQQQRQQERQQEEPFSG